MTILRLDLFRVFFTAQCDQVKFGRPPDVDMQNADDKMQMRKIMRHNDTRSDGNDNDDNKDAVDESNW